MKIQITFYPDVNKDELETEDRIENYTEFISWQRFQSTLTKRLMINEDKERLVGITITEAGIKAKIERI